jgi:hypothetical protein
MSTKKPKPSPVEVLDEITHQAAQAAVAQRKSTARDHQWSRDLGATIDARLAELRRNLTPADAPSESAKPIRPSTLAMTRDAVIEAITRLTLSMGGAVQFAHRNLTRLSDDDLRRLFDLIDPTARD